MKKKQLLHNISAIAAVSILLILFVEFASYLVVTLHQSKQNNAQRAYGTQSFGDEQKNFMTEYQGTANIPYKSFVGWQSREYHGKYINVSPNGLRITGFENKYPGSPTIHFFGGSTMWGFGLSDDGSLPSLVGKETNLNTVNYAELAWTSRQSLNRLLMHLDSIKPDDLVVFYDGGTDASYSCYPNTVGAHARESQINNALQAVAYGDRSYLSGLNAFVQNTYIFLAFKSLTAPPSPPPASSCENAETAKVAANFMIQGWKIATQLVQAKGAYFACVLHPTPFTISSLKPSDRAPPVNHESLSTINVYPIVKKEASGLPCFVDFSGELGPEAFFDSQGHITRQGNQHVAALLINKVVEKVPAYGL